MGCRGLCCCSPSLSACNEDNARFVLLAVLIVVYLLCGAAVFSAIEQPGERQAQAKWRARFDNFSQKYSLNASVLRDFLAEYELAYVNGVRIGDIRSRWDFSGAFYFVSTVVSTIGKPWRKTDPLPPPRTQAFLASLVLLFFSRVNPHT